MISITADQVRASSWQTIGQTRFTAGGWGYEWESTDFPRLRRKIWRPTRHDYTRGSLLVDGRHDGTEFPAELYAHAAELLSRPATARAAA